MGAPLRYHILFCYPSLHLKLHESHRAVRKIFFKRSTKVWLRSPKTSSQSRKRRWRAKDLVAIVASMQLLQNNFVFWTVCLFTNNNTKIIRRLGLPSHCSTRAIVVITYDEVVNNLPRFFEKISFILAFKTMGTCVDFPRPLQNTNSCFSM